MVLLEGDTLMASSAHQLGSMTAVLVTWLDELRDAGVLVATGVPDGDLLARVGGSPPLRACILIDAPNDDDARALAATCPSQVRLEADVVRMRDGP